MREVIVLTNAVTDVVTDANLLPFAFSPSSSWNVARDEATPHLSIWKLLDYSLNQINFSLSFRWFYVILRRD